MKVIVAVGVAALLGFTVSGWYSQRRVNQENQRIQRVAPTVTLPDDFVVNAAFGSDSVAAQFDVAGERIDIDVGPDGPCIAVRSEYFGRSTVSSFVARDGALTSTPHC